MMNSPSSTVTIPNVTLTLDQLLTAVRQLDEPARKQVAQVLVETQMDAKLSRLIQQLAQRPSADDLSDAAIQAEIEIVRRSDR
jgi:sulfite reductase alpha subunit-like flavoprotein